MPCYARRSVQASARPSPLTVVSGFASHLIAGVLPFFSAAAITSLGLMRGTALLYAAGATLILLACLSPRVRTTLRRETTALLVPAHRRLFAAGLAGFLFAGVWYYFGLSTSARVAEYIFLTRLDWVVQAVFAIVWLGEPWTARGAVGAGLALGGGLLLAWSGAFGPSGLAAAVLYIAASLAGYSCFKPLSAARRSPGATTLTVWRHLVNTAGFSALAVLVPAEGSGMTTAGLAAAAVAGVLIVVLFLLRFTALTELPLWVLSAQAPTQALVAVAATLATGGTLPPVSLAAIALIVAGEVLVTRSRG
jgi:drug/metabolite transporter (DMT)-like permease